MANNRPDVYSALEAKASKFQKVFLTKDGEEVLKLLTAQFSPAEL